MDPVKFFFDFGSPNAYLCHKVIPAIEARTGEKFVNVPVLLGGVFKLTGNQSPGAAFAGIRNKLDYDRLEMRRFIAKHSLSAFKWNPNFPVNTLQLMRCAVAAQHAGILAPYVQAMYACMWEQERKMDDPAVFSAALLAAGLPADALLAASATAQVKAELMANTEAAVAAGAFGSPTFLVGSELYFGKDRLRDVEDEITRQASAALRA